MQLFGSSSRAYLMYTNKYYHRTNGRDKSSLTFAVQKARKPNNKRMTVAVQNIVTVYRRRRRDGDDLLHTPRSMARAGGLSLARRINSGIARGLTMMRVEIILCPPPTG